MDNNISINVGDLVEFTESDFVDNYHHGYIDIPKGHQAKVVMIYRQSGENYFVVASELIKLGVLVSFSKVKLVCYIPQ